MDDRFSAESEKWFTVKDMANDFHFSDQTIRNHYKDLIKENPDLEKEVKKQEYGKNNGGKLIFSKRFYDVIKDSFEFPNELHEISSLFGDDDSLGVNLQRILRGKKGYSLSRLTQELIKDMLYIKELISIFKNTGDVELVEQVDRLVGKDLEEIEKLLKK